MMAVTNNAAGGKGPCFGQASNGGKREGMAETARPNHPGGRKPIDKVRQLQSELWAAAKQSIRVVASTLWTDQPPG